MNLELLMNFYANDPRCFQIAEKIAIAQPNHIHLKGLAGSASQFIVAAVFNHPSANNLNHLIILRDAEEAAYFHNTIENITRALDVFYFPSSFKNKKKSKRTHIRCFGAVNTFEHLHFNTITERIILRPANVDLGLWPYLDEALLHQSFHAISIA